MADAHAVEKAQDGVAALASSRAKPPDLVIADMLMPNSDGVGLIAASIAESPRLPIIARSGVRDSAQFLFLASYLGASRMLTKPFTPQELRTAVSGALQRSAYSHLAGPRWHGAGQPAVSGLPSFPLQESQPRSRRGISLRFGFRLVSARRALRG